MNKHILKKASIFGKIFKKIFRGAPTRVTLVTACAGCGTYCEWSYSVGIIYGRPGRIELAWKAWLSYSSVEISLGGR